MSERTYGLCYIILIVIVHLAMFDIAKIIGLVQ